MARRQIILVKDQVYHIVNRGVASQPIFLYPKHYQRAINTIFYYQNARVPLSYSELLRLSRERREQILANLAEKKNFWVEVIAYCLMPNHFHLLLKQVKSKGISIFISHFCNSYARYFNKIQNRLGPLYQGNFKAVRVETDEQLLHVSRYIHLNSYSSYVVKNLDDLKVYGYSSLPEYLQPSPNDRCQKKLVQDFFKTPKVYQKFVFNQADYQRRLDEIKHLMLEK